MAREGEDEASGVPLPSGPLIQSIEEFFHWADLKFKSPRDSLVAFKKRLGISSNEYCNWKSGIWRGKKPWPRQLAATRRLLATLSYDGQHELFIIKGTQRCVRSPDWAAYCSQRSALEQDEWTHKTEQIIAAILHYHQVLIQKQIASLEAHAVGIRNASRAARRGLHGFDLRLEEHDQYLPDFSVAKSISVSGINLRRLYPDFLPHLKNILNRGGTTKMILVKPGSAAAIYGNIQDVGPDNVDTDLFNRNLQHTLDVLSALELYAKHGHSVEIKTIDYHLSFGIDSINDDGPDNLAGHPAIDAVLYVRYYALGSDKPFIRFTPKDEPWYGFYREQFKAHWNMAGDHDSSKFFLSADYHGPIAASISVAE
jgi:hypothetical protein